MKSSIENITTPGGNLATLENPLSSETDPADSGGDQILLKTNSEICKSQNKVMLSSENTILEKLKRFESMCNELQKQVNELKVENTNLKRTISTLTQEKPLKSVPAVIDFHTDEEELERETDWILSKSKKNKKGSKKRKVESSPEICSSPEKPTTTKSVFRNIQQTVKVHKPPPVILSNVNDFNHVQVTLSSKSIKYEIKLLNNNQLKINVSSENDYRSLTSALNEGKFQWHSYENKATRPVKVIVRGLHPTCKTEDIVEELKASGFLIENAVNLMKKVKDNEHVSKVPLPLFMLTFSNQQDVKSVFAMTHISKTKIKVEALKKHKDNIPQCKRCQRYGHTTKFCNRDAKCVKCAGSHLTANCKLPKKITPKCANCQEAHPANYRGCLVAKELQKRRQTSIRKVINTPKAVTLKPTTKSVTYSDVAKGQISACAKLNDETPRRSTIISHKQSINATPNKKNRKKSKSNDDFIMKSMEKMLSMMDKISSRLEMLENRSNGKLAITSTNREAHV